MNEPSSPSFTVAVDAMGGDHAPDCNIEGAVHAIDRFGLNVILVGDEDTIRSRLKALNLESRLDGQTATFTPCPRSGGQMKNQPQPFVRKNNHQCESRANLWKTGEAQSVLSAGNSGAMMAVALFVFGRIDGVLRPAIGAVVPTLNQWRTGILVDAGANTDCEPHYLTQFALMGHAYLKSVFQIPITKSWRFI